MTRRQAEDWLRAAQRALAAEGPDGVRIESLARELGVSKGSFYGYFADRAALLEQLLQRWESRSAWLIAESRKAATPAARLERLLELIAAAQAPAGTPHDDSAIFRWSRQDPSIAARVAAVEQRRIGYLEELLRDHGVAPQQARMRAAFALAAFNGYVEQLGRNVTALSFDDFHSIIALLLVR